MSEDNCAEVKHLHGRIDALESKFDITIKTLTEKIDEIRLMMAEMMKEIKELREHDNSHDIALAVIQAQQDDNAKRLSYLEKESIKHGNRLAQVAVVAIGISVLLPVAFEKFIDAPTEEVSFFVPE